MFRSLRGKIDEFAKQPGHTLNPLEGNNYKVTCPGQGEKLYSNLYNTEIDIVLETPGHLFIGEAKGEAGLGANGDYMLVHQLIRQYVMARILLKLKECDKEVVPFLVVQDDRRGSVLNTGQVRFMAKCKKWLKKGNVLTWGDIRSLQHWTKPE